MAPSTNVRNDRNNKNHNVVTTIPDGAFRILITGFGPFNGFAENPSWLAVKPLHNIVITPDTSSESLADIDGMPITLEECRSKSPIHITAFEVPVTYDDILNIVPALHARPPVLPPLVAPTSAPPPESGYDVILHVGVGDTGPLEVEKVGHKYGYNMKDAKGKMAPIVQVQRPPSKKANGGTKNNVVRGFSAGYESFPSELATDVDVDRLVRDLQQSGTSIKASQDAGHFLCDFIYYCSLAESRRNNPNQNRTRTPVLFLHCCPVDQPLSTKEVTEEIKKVVVWVCNELLKNKTG